MEEKQSCEPLSEFALSAESLLKYQFANEIAISDDNSNQSDISKHFHRNAATLDVYKTSAFSSKELTDDDVKLKFVYPRLRGLSLPNS